MDEHGTKTTPVFLPADGEASWSLLPSLVSLLSGGIVLLEDTYSCIRRSEKAKKRTSINHSSHQAFISLT